MLEQVFSSSIAWYLFLAGAGSGAFTLAAVLNYVAQTSTKAQAHEYGQIAQGGLYLGPLLVLFGSVFLIFDLGTPQNAYLILFNPQFTVITVGTLLIICFCVAAAAFLFIKSNNGFAAPFVLEALVGSVACVCALGIMVYTGLFFSSLQAIPFLNTPALVALFVLSSLSSGVAVISLYGFLSQRRKAVTFGMRLMPRLDITFVFCEILALTIMIFTLQWGSTVAQQTTAQMSVQILLSGDLAPLFWLGVVGAGLAVPAIIGIFMGRQARPTLLATSALSVLGGAFALRYCLLMAGQHIDPSLFL